MRGGVDLVIFFDILTKNSNIKSGCRYPDVIRMQIVIDILNSNLNTIQYNIPCNEIIKLPGNPYSQEGEEAIPNLMN